MACALIQIPENLKLPTIARKLRLAALCPLYEGYFNFQGAKYV